MKVVKRFVTPLVILLCMGALKPAAPTMAAEQLTSFDQRALQQARSCAEEVVSQFDLLLTSGKLTMAQLFDTFYIPIPGTDPQKYHTQYDKLTDGILRPILDKYLDQEKRFIFVGESNIIMN